MYGQNRREELLAARALRIPAQRPTRQPSLTGARSLDHRRSVPGNSSVSPAHVDPLAASKGVLSGVAVGAALWGTLIALFSWVV